MTPARRKQEILDAASTLIASRGFDSIAVADIADVVGVTAPALYRHFESKEAIQRELTNQVLDRLAQLLDIAQRADAPVVTIVELLTTEVLDHPARTVAHLRERRRLATREHDALRRREGEFFEGFAGLVATAVPDADRLAVRLRVDAAVGVLRACAERAPRLPRPHADTFVAAALLALLRTPPSKAHRRAHSARKEPAWQPAPTPRARILAAALPLFRDHGVDGTSVSLIGETAGVGANNVGRHYQSKADILVDIYDDVGARVQVGVEDAIHAAAGPRDALTRLIESYTQTAFDAADLVIVVSENRGALPASERPRLRRRDRRVMDVWRAVIAACRPELKAAEIATLAALAFPAINALARQNADDLPSRAEVTALVDAFIMGGHRH